MTKLNFKGDGGKSLLILYGPYLLHLLRTLNMALTVVFNYFKRKEIVRCMNVIHQFDCMLLQGGHGKGRLDRCDVMQ